MGYDKRILAELPVKSGGDKTTHLRISVNYRIGGTNFFTYENQKRGLYIDVSPIGKSPNCVSYVGFSGTCMHVKEMKRFNQKTLNEYVPNPESIMRLVQDVIGRNNIVLEKEFEGLEA
jgi:hypothetical protein